MENMENIQNTETPKPKEGLNKNLAIICGTIIVVSIIISATVLSGGFNFSKLGNPGNNGAGQQQQQPAQAADISKVKTAGNPFIGNASAPVVVAEWMDYQCPFCKRFNDQVMPQLMKDYIETGKVKVVFKDYQFLGADSQTAGLAGRAVWEVAPNKYYDWHKAMYDKQDNENGGWGSRADILALVKSLGIDSSKVDQLMTSKVKEYQKAMDADKAEGTSMGINGTPGTIIGKQLISGAQPYAAFKQVIDVTLQGK